MPYESETELTPWARYIDADGYMFKRRWHPRGAYRGRDGNAPLIQFEKHEWNEIKHASQLYTG